VNEADVVLRARQMSRHLTADQVRLPLPQFVKELKGVANNIVIRFDDTLAADEAGHTVPVGSKQCIIINANDRAERQRFTACHEVAHLVLGLATEHGDREGPFPGRSPNEILCDVFAAELLLPSHLARPIVEDSDLELASVECLARTFGASLSAAGSRFAALCDRPCAFVLIQNGMVRYASRSQSLQAKGAFVRPRQTVPAQSMAARLLRNETVDGPIEVNADEWFDDWRGGGVVLEEARLAARWNHALSLVWFDDDDGTADGDVGDDGEGESLLRPLDGVLQWPGKKRRP
jgi:Zn-dependent peptidase ImmA (M78 family)